MGLLSEGHTLTWEQAQPVLHHVSLHGIQQFLFVYQQVKNRTRDCLFWGDEVEYMILHFDPERRRVALRLSGHEVLSRLAAKMATLSPGKPTTRFLPEYGSFMVEATPGQPYHGDNSSFRFVEPNMRLRRELIHSVLGPNEMVMSVTSFPLLGVGDCTEPPAPAGGPVTQSLYVPDSVINPHPRFGTLTRNIRERRGEKVNILIPLYRDQHTEARAGLPASMPELPDWYIHMDAMAFGMGCCCLQVTFQCPNISAARYLYDQQSVICPIMMALTAAAPVFRGFLADYDVRWRVISGAVDDRTPEERGLRPLQPGHRRIRKSRYDAISTYISESRALRPEYNDLPLELNDEVYALLREQGVDELLARHFAHLWIRDPLVVYNETVYVDDRTNSNHFENIQSTNWQTMRFKPPPPDSNLGWRVEFRSMEVQLTDFENAAFTVFVSLLTRAILEWQLNFYIPMSKSEDNMETAHRRGALRNCRFYFRKHVVSLHDVQDPAQLDDSVELMTVNEIVNGVGDWVGLVGLVRKYVASHHDFDSKTLSAISTYLDFVSRRASGDLMCMAEWIRHFVTSHPAYRQDSVVSPDIAFDLMQACSEVSAGKRAAPELLGGYNDAPTASYDGPEAQFGSGHCCGSEGALSFQVR